MKSKIYKRSGKWPDFYFLGGTHLDDNEFTLLQNACVTRLVNPLLVFNYDEAN